MIDLFDPPAFKRKVAAVVEEKNFWLKKFFGLPAVKANAVSQQYLSVAKRLRPLGQGHRFVPRYAIA
jgi:adenylosuccinate synthase